MMARYANDARDKVRDAVDFVELVGARTELRRAGANRYVGLCPFHDERTPSFGIDPGEKLYHCFGCGEGGDVFRFVMETEGLDFTGALEVLADRSGVELEREAEDPQAAQRRDRRERLLALLERTTAYYVRVLWESAEAADARAYLAGRGLDERILREFRVGWAPSAWDRVLLASRRAGYSEEELVATGLARRGREGRGVFDRFRARIMFPLADPRGRVLGFGARALRDNQGPKYLNSSDGEIYSKGQHLYAHDLARAPAARAARVVLCEGYTDVIALHQAGVREVVGLMGTALTPAQADKLRQLAPSVVLCLDADAAGREAMARAAELLAGPRRELRVVALPAGQDPADLVAASGGGDGVEPSDGLDATPGPSEAANAVRGLLDRAVPFARFEVDRVLEGGDLASPEGRDRAVDLLRPVFAGVGEGLLRQDLLGSVADRLDATPDLLARLLPVGRGGGPSSRRPSPAPAPGAGAAGGDVRVGPGAPSGAAGERGSAGAGAGSGASAGAGAGGGAGARPGGDGGGGLGRRGDETERAFLARCLAVDEEGRRLLEAADLSELFASELNGRAARHLLAHPEAPAEAVSPEDPELARVVAELVMRSGDLPADRDALAVEHLQLVMLRLDRAIVAARRSGGSSLELAGERKRVQDEIRHRLV